MNRILIRRAETLGNAAPYWLLDEHGKARLDLEHAHQLDPSIATWQERFREFEGMF